MASLSTALLLPPCPSSLVHNPNLRVSFIRSQSFTYRINTQLRRASSRSPNFSQEGANLGADPVSGERIWSRTISSVYGVDREFGDEEDDSDEEEDRSLDLLVRFVQNVFRKISKRARRAVRSVLPLSIPTELVGFSVNGVLVLAFLWVLKAFLEVVCTLGSVVFVSILLIRGVWTGVAYLQEARYHKLNGVNDDPRAWTNAQPVT
ncbi:uncharacterized protein LOC116202290 [Punica granatum]|uniref:Protein SHORT HYPOCOTYL IN WHITE LIGHT 1 n=2 Tax=Punica granatum TaxID=22663 RepID=A0A218VWR5_PUNGR|nr:uncharacterized protein LOC116202290 [Punica granatum]OWM64773.1 hypothetical protein CDL15_Pgr028490 [Punica granatum]PKI71614.1 hypothetical protein CRG98_007937 [Punica granatum]